MNSAKILIKDGVTSGGSRIELISWKQNCDNGDELLVRQIDVDDRMICRVSVDLSADPSGWSSEQLYASYCLMF